MKRFLILVLALLLLLPCAAAGAAFAEGVPTSTVSVPSGTVASTTAASAATTAAASTTAASAATTAAASTTAESAATTAAASTTEQANWFTDLKDQFVLNFIDGDRWEFILEGLLNTLLLTVFSALIGIVLGIVVAAVRTTYDNNQESLRKNKGIGYYVFSFFNWFCKLYLTVIRGTPVVVQLLIMFFIVFATTDDGLLVATIAFGINSGAYVAEIFRGGIMSVDKGQLEAGRSIGFNYLQTMLFIILPQAIKNVLPTLLNEFIALLKETSVAGYVGVMDLTKAGNNIRNHTYSPFMPLIALALIYLGMVVLLTWLVGKLERRLRKSDR